jgi:hypothetical protein
MSRSSDSRRSARLRAVTQAPRRAPRPLKPVPGQAGRAGETHQGAKRALVAVWRRSSPPLRSTCRVPDALLPRPCAASSRTALSSPFFGIKITPNALNATRLLSFRSSPGSRKDMPRVKRIAGRLDWSPASDSPKAMSASTFWTDRAPWGHRERHARKQWPAKAWNHQRLLPGFQPIGRLTTATRLLRWGILAPAGMAATLAANQLSWCLQGHCYDESHTLV